MNTESSGSQNDTINSSVLEKCQTKETAATGIFYPRYNQHSNNTSKFSKAIESHRFHVQVRKNNELVNGISRCSNTQSNSNSDLKTGCETERKIKIDNQTQPQPAKAYRNYMHLRFKS